MKLCTRCQAALYSRGERFRVIKYYGYWDEVDKEEYEKCEWCGEEDELDEVEF